MSYLIRRVRLCGQLVGIINFKNLIIVSGFYAECPSKNMYVNASVYTKSKFLGLSLGVHNIGSGQSISSLLLKTLYQHVFNICMQ